MPVYDVAAGQRLSDPFAATDRRKMLKQAFAGEELTQEMQRAQIDAYPEQQAAAQREEQRKVDEAQRKADEDAQKKHEYQRDGITGAAAAGVEAYDSAGGEDNLEAANEAGRKAFNDYNKNYFSSVDYDRIQKEIELDNDWDQSGALAIAPSGEAEYKAKDTYVGEDGIEYHMWYDQAGNAHKTNIQAKLPSGEQVDFEPPNASEMETARQLVEKDKMLSDLGTKDKDIVIHAIASEIRQLQVQGLSYDESATVAVKRIKEKIRTESGFFGMTKSVLDLAPKDDLDLYNGKDGKQYRMMPDGSFKVVE